MPNSQRDESLASNIPSHEQDPVERRRLLNILAQRRYRDRRRERLQRTGTQIEPESSAAGEITGDDNQSIAGAFGVHGSSEDPSSQPGTLFAQYDSPTIEDAFLLPLSQLETMQSPLQSVDYSANFPTFSLGQDIFQPLPSSLNSEPSPGGAPLLTSNAPIEPTPASPYTDYAITNPGLSVICAKVNLFNTMLGPGFSFDIWNPRALSPICLNAPIRPCPANFQPTPLQRMIHHHPVIDVFPWPMFRDTFLYTMTLPKELRPRIAQNEMPMVTMEVMMAAKEIDGGIRVWGSNAFLPENWEVGQTFYSKFWWALDASIVRCSNRHRARRGEGQLRFDFMAAT